MRKIVEREVRYLARERLLAWCSGDGSVLCGAVAAAPAGIGLCIWIGIWKGICGNTWLTGKWPGPTMATSWCLLGRESVCHVWSHDETTIAMRRVWHLQLVRAPAWTMPTVLHVRMDDWIAVGLVEERVLAHLYARRSSRAAPWLAAARLRLCSCPPSPG